MLRPEPEAACVREGEVEQVGERQGGPRRRPVADRHAEERERRRPREERGSQLDPTEGCEGDGRHQDGDSDHDRRRRGREDSGREHPRDEPDAHSDRERSEVRLPG